MYSIKHMKKHTVWIITGSVLAGGIIVYLLTKKKRKAEDSKGQQDDNGYIPITENGNSTSGNNSSPVSKKVYSAKAGLSIRESPELSDGFLGLGSNHFMAVDTPDIYVGTLLSNTPIADKDGDINPKTSQVFKWWMIQISPTLGGSGVYYVREDYVKIK